MGLFFYRPDRLNAARYDCEFLETDFFDYLNIYEDIHEDIHLQQRNVMIEMWFQFNEYPAHYGWITQV